MPSLKHAFSDSLLIRLFLILMQVAYIFVNLLASFGGFLLLNILAVL